MILEHYDLEYYAEEMKQIDLLAAKNLFAKKDTLISGITFNSKDVKNNDLFICKGSNFKVDYLEEALEQGAVGYISEKKYDLGKDIPYILVTDIRQAMAPLASIFYNQPQEKIKIIAIGGTKGKTTTSYFVKAMLDEYLYHQHKKPAGLISTIVTYDGIEEEPSQNTTPEAVDLMRHLSNGVKSGLEYFVVEVSSQALKYHRTDGLPFEAAVFLNIDEDHISPIEHPNYEDYLESKLKMFSQTKHLVVNNETSEREKVLERAATDAKDYQTFSLVSEQTDFYVHDIQSDGFKTNFKVRTKDWEQAYQLSMPGLFNVENAAAVIAIADILQIPQHHVQKVLKDIAVPGRTEVYQTADQKIIAMVDYAHNRLSFENLFKSVQENYPGYRIISVFGATGSKALGRKKDLGTVAGIYADFVYLTMDDPGYQEVREISEEIAVYLEKSGTPYAMIDDRAQAIETAFRDVQEKTIILLMGKGQDDTNKIKGKEVPYATDGYYVKKLIAAYDTGIFK